MRGVDERGGQAAAVPVLLCAAFLGFASLGGADRPVDGAAVRIDPDGRRLYEDACAACHGSDGRGADPAVTALEVPDFTECTFASREPNADWVGVAHGGGPVRGFAPTMPAFGDALTLEELRSVMAYVRTFCGDDAWPRGELNLPRPLITEKAYPEDEAVMTVGVNAESPGAVMNELLYEKRFGARNQIEVILPFGARQSDGPSGDWNAGIGDLALGVKRALWHSYDAGSILSLGAEVILPTGDRSAGLGKGTTFGEPFVAFGQILPGGAFLHLQGIVEFPFDADAGETEGIARAALGMSRTQGRFGRTWSPMVEVIAKRALDEEDATTSWDVVPQLQVTLNTRQHVMLNVGVRVPVTDSELRQTEVLVYLLWDWFDGGFFEGW